MKLNFVALLLFLFIQQSYLVSGKSLSEIIPAGYEVLDSVSGNLNDDQFRDMILVLKREKEDSLSPISDFAIKRETIILYGSENGYSVVARNMNVVSCLTCGGMMGDPYVGISISDKSFSVSHYGGAVWRWGRVSTFSRNANGIWVLIEDENETFNAVNEERTRETVKTTSKDFGVITFEQYDFDKE